MSDLAPFVAAAIRDKVVADLEKENKELRERLAFSQRVQVKTAPCFVDNAVVYADALLQDAVLDYRNCATLKVFLSKKKPCPLHRLASVQLCVGDNCKVDFSDINWHGDGDTLTLLFNFDGVSTKSSHQFFAVFGPVANVVVGFTIHGWPRQDRAHLLGQTGGDPLLPISVLAQVCQRHPEATVSFQYTGFNAKNVLGVIENLSEPARSRLLNRFEKAKRRAAKAGRPVSSLGY